MIHIMGAGLGGLALAQGLMKRGIPCHLFEREESPLTRTQGFRISLNTQGREALRELLPPERYARLVALRASNVGHDFHFARDPKTPFMHMEADAWTFCRPALRAILLEDVPVTWGQNTPVVSELVVGADGVHSAVRKITGGPAIITHDVCTIAAYVDRTPEWDALLPLNRQGAVQYLGPAGQTMFVSFCEREDRSPVILWALSQRGESVTPHQDWDRALRALMNENPDVMTLEQIYSSRITLPKERLHPHMTLLGDAAHAMPPQRGLGGNSAFEDARRLIDSLDDIGGYEREMFTRGKKAVEESEEALQLAHMKSPITRGLRNTVLRTVGFFQRL